MRERRVLAPAFVYLEGVFVSGVHVTLAEDGSIERVGAPDAAVDLPVESMPDEALLPGMVNAHSHAFQRGLRGKAESFGTGSGSFWSWREEMYRLANEVDEDRFTRLSRLAFDEMLRGGITSVGEFHYLHHAGDDDDYALDEAMVSAANASSIRLAALDVCYLAGGVDEPLLPEQRRFGSRSVEAFLRSAERLGESLSPSHSLGIVAHSLRAVPPEAVAELHRYALAHGLVFHVHAEEQQREVEDVEARYGMTPLRCLLDGLELGPELTAVHCTKSSRDDLAELRDRGANVVLCPLTEASLADGVVPRELANAEALALGTDSNLRIDLTEEMRLLEYGARLTQERRGVYVSAAGSVAERLFRIATEGGARSLGLDAGRIATGSLADLFTLDLAHPSLAEAAPGELLTAFVLGAGRSAVRRVAVGGEWVFGE